jgi:hypothetical protein
MGTPVNVRMINLQSGYRIRSAEDDRPFERPIAFDVGRASPEGAQYGAARHPRTLETHIASYPSAACSSRMGDAGWNWPPTVRR